MHCCQCWPNSATHVSTFKNETVSSQGQGQGTPLWRSRLITWRRFFWPCGVTFLSSRSILVPISIKVWSDDLVMGWEMQYNTLFLLMSVALVLWQPKIFFCCKQSLLSSSYQSPPIRIDAERIFGMPLSFFSLSNPGALFRKHKEFFLL